MDDRTSVAAGPADSQEGEQPAPEHREHAEVERVGTKPARRGADRAAADVAYRSAARRPHVLKSAKAEEKLPVAVHHLAADAEPHLPDLHQGKEAAVQRMRGVGVDAET